MQFKFSILIVHKFSFKLVFMNINFCFKWYLKLGTNFIGFHDYILWLFIPIKFSYFKDISSFKYLIVEIFI